MTEQQANTNFNFRKYAWQQFKKNKPALISLYFLIGLCLIGVLAPIIANKHPLYATYKGQSYMPAFKMLFNETYTDTIKSENGSQELLEFHNVDWRKLAMDNVVWAPIPYSPNSTDKYNRDYVAPGEKQVYKNPEGEIVECPTILRHHMGTDQVGRDVMAGLIHGTKVSLTVGLISMGIASILGILFGSIAGYYGDSHLKFTRLRYWLTLTGLFLGLFYGFIARSDALYLGFEESVASGFFVLLFNLIILVAFTIGFNYLGKKINVKGFFGEIKPVAIDSYISRIIEILNSLPNLLLIITIAAVMKERSLTVVMVIIGCTSWTGIARFVRAELLRIREAEYIQSARAMGFSDFRIVFRHALPNGLAAVFVSVAFGVAAAILVESSLSFLGIGVPADQVTWGSLLSEGKKEFEAWWLVLYPGLAIFLTITVYNLIGEGLRDALDPKLKE